MIPYSQLNNLSTVDTVITIMAIIVFEEFDFKRVCLLFDDEVNKNLTEAQR